jgi:hypothetical protein
MRAEARAGENVATASQQASISTQISVPDFASKPLLGYGEAWHGGEGLTPPVDGSGLYWTADPSQSSLQPYLPPILSGHPTNGNDNTADSPNECEYDMPNGH